MLFLLVLLPWFGGMGSLVVPGNLERRIIFLFASSLHFALVGVTWIDRPHPTLQGLIHLDVVGLFLLTTLSFTNWCHALYTMGYLGSGVSTPRSLSEDEPPSISQRGFISISLFLLGLLSFLSITQHYWVIALAWVLALFGTASFFLIRWPILLTYSILLICSLFGHGCYWMAIHGIATEGWNPYLLRNLLTADSLHSHWLFLANLWFLAHVLGILFLLHQVDWHYLDHGAVPAAVLSLLGVGFVNAGLLFLIRAYAMPMQIDQRLWLQKTLFVLGLTVMAWGLLAIRFRKEYFRIGSDCSTIHAGVILFALGLAGDGILLSAKQILVRSCATAILFLVTGNIYAYYRTTEIPDVRGLVRRLPIQFGFYLFAGIVLLTSICFPSIGTFPSLFAIVQARPDWLVPIYLGFFAFVLCCTLAYRLKRMASGQGFPARESTLIPDHKGLFLIPILLLCVPILLVWLYSPDPLQELFQEWQILLANVSSL